MEKLDAVTERLSPTDVLFTHVIVTEEMSLSDIWLLLMMRDCAAWIEKLPEAMFYCSWISPPHILQMSPDSSSTFSLFFMLKMFFLYSKAQSNIFVFSHYFFYCPVCQIVSHLMRCTCPTLCLSCPFLNLDLVQVTVIWMPVAQFLVETNAEMVWQSLVSLKHTRLIKQMSIIKERKKKREARAIPVWGEVH